MLYFVILHRCLQPGTYRMVLTHLLCLSPYPDGDRKPVLDFLVSQTHTTMQNG